MDKEKQIMEKQPVFLGTLFDRDQVLKIELWLRIISWAALAANIFENGLYAFQTVYNPFIGGFSIDYSMLILNIAHISQGAMYFIFLQALAKLLLILLDIEENTRNTARLNSQKK